jgi:hypothetical protein
VDNVSHFHAVLPSITADETIQSDLSQHGIYRAHGKATATLRVFPAAAGQQLREERTYLTIDGKAVRADKKEKLPFELNGAFSAIAEMFFTPAHVFCYSFTAMPPAADGAVQYSFVTRPDLPADCKNVGVTVRGLVQADPASAEIRHIERTITSPAAQGQHQVTFIGVDYASAAIGSKTYDLPKELKADLDGNLGHFVAQYSGFRRFAATVTIRSGDEPPPNTP